MASTFENFGVRFLFPENWELSEDASQRPRNVQVQSPTGAFWSLYVYDTPGDPEELLAEAVKTMRGEYEGLESREISRQLDSVEAAGCELDFYCLDLLISCSMCSFVLDEKSYLVICQAENRDFDELRVVFDAITVSLIRGGKIES